MRVSVACALLPLAASAANIVLGNDDGWAEINIRTLYKALVAAGESVVLSAPAQDKSGTGSTDMPATALTEPCEFNSCRTGSPAEGFNASNHHLNYVNSYPVTAIKYGISTLAPKFFKNGKIDLAVTGFNVGANEGAAALASGTVGAATYAANNKIPAIAFSGTTGSQTAWTVAPVPAYAKLYAALSTTVTKAVLAAGTPYLPPQVYLNVNFPAAGAGTNCTAARDFKFVLSRILPAVPLVTPDDVATCGSKRLPTESSVTAAEGCYVSISVGSSMSKLDSTAKDQAVVLRKLRKILSCLPAQ